MCFFQSKSTSPKVIQGIPKQEEASKLTDTKVDYEFTFEPKPIKTEATVNLSSHLDALACEIKNVRDEFTIQIIDVLARIQSLETRSSERNSLTLFQILVLLRDAPRTNNPDEWVTWLEGNRYVAIVADQNGLGECFVNQLYAKVKLAAVYHCDTYKEPTTTVASDFLQISINAFLKSRPLYEDLATQIRCNPINNINVLSREWRRWFREFTKLFLSSVPYLDELDTLNLLNEFYENVEGLESELHFAIIRHSVTIRNILHEYDRDKSVIAADARAIFQDTLAEISRFVSKTKVPMIHNQRTHAAKMIEVGEFEDKFSWPSV
ncbi:hypothetical protein DICA4_F21484 [Diutina catenulata]